MAPDPVPVAIVGAGPYGLAVAAHLGSLGVGHRIFGEPMEGWRQRMPPGMFLKSEGCASSISAPAAGSSLADFCAERGLDYADYWLPVPLATFVEYGLWFQVRLAPRVENARATSVRPRRGGLEVGLSTGEVVRARRVVVATGGWDYAHVPRVLRDLGPPLVSHASDYGDVGALAGRDVIVIGGGQSALETAALASEAGARVRVLVRGPRVAWNEGPEQTPPSTWRTRARRPPSRLGAGWRLWLASNWSPAFRHLPSQTRLRLVRTTLGPAGAWWLRQRVEEHVPVIVNAHVRSASAIDGTIRLSVVGADGPLQELVTEHVIAATGYRLDLSRLPFLERSTAIRLRTVGGAPRLSGVFESTIPGLHFVGLAAAPSFGPICRFVAGTYATAPRLARRLARAT